MRLLGLVSLAHGHLGIPWRERVSGVGWEQALLHPSCLHVAQSALRLGSIEWQDLKRTIHSIEVNRFTISA